MSPGTSKGPNRLWLIARREFRERISQRAFKIAVVLGAIVAALATAAPPLLIGDDESTSREKIAVVAVSGGSARVDALQEATRGPGGVGLEIVESKDRAAASKLVGDGDVELGVLLGGDPASPDVTIVTREDGGGTTTDDALAAVQRTSVIARAEQAGLAPNDAASLLALGDVKSELVTGSGPSSEAAAVAFVLVLVLYVSIIVLVQGAATGLVSDRSARVTERLLTAAKPRDHLYGKLLGVGASGMLQLAAWFAAGLLADAIVSGSGRDGVLSGVPAELLICFPIALVGAYVLYAAVSTLLILPVEKPEDVGGATTPGTMVLIVGFVLATTIIAPGATVSSTLEWLSLVPFFSPMLMLARVAGGDVPLWEVAVGMAGPLVLGGLILAWLAPAYARNAVDPPGGSGLKAALALVRR